MEKSEKAPGNFKQLSAVERYLSMVRSTKSFTFIQHGTYLSWFPSVPIAWPPGGKASFCQISMWFSNISSAQTRRLFHNELYEQSTTIILNSFLPKRDFWNIRASSSFIGTSTVIYCSLRTAAAIFLPCGKQLRKKGKKPYF